MGRILLAVAILVMAGPLGAATFYVDAAAGDDANPGASPDKAWKTLQPVNDKSLQPGDRVLFKAGTRYAGQLAPKAAAAGDAAPDPILIDMYGDGPLPRIDGEGKFLDTILIRNLSHVTVRNLEVTNLGPTAAPRRTGVHVVSDGFGVMKNVRLERLYVHDVNGDLRKSQEGCGIFFDSRGGNGSRFDGLIVENCHVVRTDRNGICQRGGGRDRSTNVVIRNNLLEDVGGDGIKLWGTNGGLVEKNVVRGGRMRAQDAAVGIWPFACDDTLVQYNEVSGYKGTNDGQGFDSDYQCRNSVFQYNYSHDNEGGFFLLCAPGNSYCEGTVIRYNISQNDGIKTARVFQLGGNIANSRIYNNVIYIAPGQDLPLVASNEWNRGNAKDTYFYNNIFYVDGKVRYKWDKSTNNVFEGNIFYGNHAAAPADEKGGTAKPPLLKPGSGGNGFDTLGGYRLDPKAPAVKGKVIPNNGGYDFFGNPVPVDAAPAVGVAEGQRS